MSRITIGRRWCASGLLAAVLVIMSAGGQSGGHGRAAAQTTGGTAALPSCQPATPAVVSESSPILQNNAVQQVLASFDQGFETQLREPDNLPGVAVSIVYDGAVIWARGFGCADLTQQSPVTTETVFGLGSVSKMFTAVMLMQLVEAGTVQLSDPINQYVPGAQYQAPGGGTVSPTFVQLASHTSGLPSTVVTATTFPGMLQQLQQTTAQSTPGTAYLYSDLGYAVLGQVLAQIAGVPYEQYVTDKILMPLGMTSSGFSGPSVPQAGYATPYTSTSPPEAATYLPWGLNNPSAGLNSTALDMAQFMKMVIGNGSANGAQILAPSSMHAMTEQVTAAGPAPLTGIGIGWQFYTPQQGLDFYGKDGFIDGFVADLVFAEGSQLGVFVVTNQGNPTNPGQTPIAVLGAGEAAIARLTAALAPASGGQ